MPRVRTPRSATVAALLAAVSNTACASPSPEAASARAAWSPRATASAQRLEAFLENTSPSGRSEAVVVQLAFESDVDLDLYVSGPLEETVYYGNSAARTGGELAADRRCADTPADGHVRVETVRFAPPQRGRYRVGVDFPERCRGAAEPAAFAISVATPNLRRVQRGLASVRVYQPIAVEFEFELE